VQPDNVTIQMTVLPTLREFLGYDDPGNIWATGGPSAPPDRVPLPKFRLRQIATSALVYDGQTLVIGGGEARTVQRERAANGTVTTNYLDKALFYFITPRLVDPAGNPLRSDDELKVLHKNLPPAVPDTRSKGRPR
jgi:hypothetical protein